jgi:guanylate kinase
VILSSPSGGGKTTIAKRLLELRDDMGYSVSATTRTPRLGETDGVSYHFMARSEFSAAVARNEFAEFAEVHGNMYGTLRREVERVLDSGKHVVMDIDVQGAEQFSAAFPEAVQIFVLPPSGQALVQRLYSRGTESPESLTRRLSSALRELRMVERYEYVVVNDVLDRAVASVSGIIDAESLSRERSTVLAGLVSEIVGVLEQELLHLSSESKESNHARSHA